jgi:23S rRNA (cytosine1962-C5)-methyltransferase
MTFSEKIELQSPHSFPEYELIDCGDFMKLERFGEYITIRPEPQAVWAPGLSPAQWQKRAHVEFVPKSSSSGEWKTLKQMPDQWHIHYDLKAEGEKKRMTMRLALTAFKHVGIFPEQAVNWDRIYSFCLENTPVKFLNLFAYTGGASIAARAGGADVTHVDSIRQVVTWANENMQLSKLDNIRWMIDDALKFVKKEVRRGNKYQCIILDPPAYGHGPAGEKWKLEENISEMMEAVLQILDPKKHLLILNAYSLGFSAIVPHNLLLPYAQKHKSSLTAGELFLPATSGMRLPLGVWGVLEKN